MINSLRFASGPAGFTFLLIAGAFVTGPALADTVKAEIGTPLPTYKVLSNGSSYHQVQGNIGSVAFSVTADAEVAGQVRSVSYDATARATGAAGGPFVLTSVSDQRTFSGMFHKVESLAGAYQPSPAELVAACNHLADGLRAQNKGNGEIFGQDRELELTITVAPDASFSGPSGFKNAPKLASETTRITCMKWAGAVGFAKPASLKATDGVSDAHLTLIEQYGPSGMCEIILSGVITTTSPNMQVRFRYEHFDGKKSEVHNVATDHSRTAMFSHRYSVPNRSGPEGGSVRMVGISPTFTSNAAAYSMDCRESGPTGLQAPKNEPPNPAAIAVPTSPPEAARPLRSRPGPRRPEAQQATPPAGTSPARPSEPAERAPERDPVPRGTLRQPESTHTVQQERSASASQNPP